MIRSIFMRKNYTIFNEQSISDFPFVDEDTEAAEFLKSPGNFRPFDQGLTELLEKKQFPGDLDSPYEKADYLTARLREIQSDIGSETVYSWFAGKHRPKVEPGSRIRMYEICFALRLTLSETVWFFHHVYYDRCFNCHTIEEAVFYFSFLHGISYPKALKIIDSIRSVDTGETAAEAPGPDYTRFVQDRITQFQTTQELQAFLLYNRPAFRMWNHSALASIQKLLSEITGDSHSKSAIEHLKRTLIRHTQSGSGMRLNPSCENDIRQCGLLLRELWQDAKQDHASAAEYVLEAVRGKNTLKNTFVLDRLLSTVTGMSKNPDIPYIVRNNFPSKKVLSDVLDASKVTASRSYDSIRKTLVLLDFYVFWVCVKLGITDVTDYDQEERAQIYRDEADARLYDCGYEPLYAGNPYDWIFLCAAQNEEPLTFFRGMVAELLPDG